MHDEGMNYTRIFTGSYVEIPGSFGIENNTLVSVIGSFITLWKRVEEAGLYKGEKKLDLSQWNPEYFSRLKDFISMLEDEDGDLKLSFDPIYLKKGINNINNMLITTIGDKIIIVPTIVK